MDESTQKMDGFVSRKDKSQLKKGPILDLDVGRQTRALGILPIMEEAPMAIQKKLLPKKGRGNPRGIGSTWKEAHLVA